MFVEASSSIGRKQSDLFGGMRRGQGAPIMGAEHTFNALCARKSDVLVVVVLFDIETIEVIQNTQVFKGWRFLGGQL